jgi:hypothetical protein
MVKMNKSIIIAILLYTLGQIMVWFQSNGQFFFEFIKRNPFLTSFIGVPVSYVFIKATAVSYIGFGQLWPGRMIGFAVGMIIFALLSATVMGESISLKTFICLLLSAVIIFVQLFIK